MRFSATFAILSLFSTVLAHPGEHEEHDSLARREFLHEAKRAISDCSASLYARGHEAASVARRAQLAKTLREELGLPHRSFLDKRDFATVLNTTHHSNKTHLSLLSPTSDIFTGELQCVLQPEVTEGPYYVKGELLRADIHEHQPGVPLFIDYQIVDINTCTPAKDIHLDTWHTNSTGVYAGVVAGGNGDSNDLTNINATFNRGIQKTNHDGVAFVRTNFPGHYSGRTTHVHLLATVNATVAQNGTLVGGSVAHVGQVFFDQDLITTVELNEPYANNTQALLLNKNDGIFAQEAALVDPVLNYVWLGPKASDGILAWVTIGINTTASYSPHPAVFWTENGGVVNPDGFPGGPGGPPPSGFPTDVPLPTASTTTDATSSTSA